MGRNVVLFAPRRPGGDAERIITGLKRRMRGQVTDCRRDRDPEGIIAVENDGYEDVAETLDDIDPNWQVWLEEIRVSPGRIIELLHR